MLIKCISNRGVTLPPAYLDSRRGIDGATTFPLTVGGEYVVYAVTSYLGGPWYFIADDDFTFYPVWSPAPLFTVADGRISTLWRTTHHLRDDAFGWLLAPEPWAEDPSFYERLTDADPDAIEAFAQIRSALDAEHFPRI